MKRFELIAFGLVCVMFSGIVQAAGKQDPNGNWKWSVTRSDNVVVDFSLKLKYEDSKLTGTITLPNKNTIDIENASFKDDEVAFTVKQPGAVGKTTTTKYKGKLDGDAIKGTLESDAKAARNQNGVWEPKREKP